MNIQVSSLPKTPETSSKSAMVLQREAYLARLLSQSQALKLQAVDAETAGWLDELRNYAANQASELALPTMRDEAWRFTDISPLLEFTFQPAAVGMLEGGEIERLCEGEVDRSILPESSNTRLVFVDGVYAPQYSSLADLPDGVLVAPIAELPRDYRLRSQRYLGKQPGAAEVFTALNTTALTDVAVVWVAKNQAIESPIHVLFLSTATETPTIAQPRCLVVAESGSAVTLVEEYGTVGGGVSLTNGVTEIWLEDNAQVNHSCIQRHSERTFHVGKTSVSQSRDSRYVGNAISLGAQLSRHHLNIFQLGEQIETVLNGLTLARREQLADIHSSIAHTQPHGSSNQLHKCIVCDRAHTVFDGRVSVPQTAQLTNAAQLNTNLLLSPKARVDTKPQLEIVADNVKCSHGATISQLEAEEIFYLQSRCLDVESARNLLIYGFAAEIIDRIPVASVRKTLCSTVKQLKVQS